jgi:hypothetical protein
MNKPIDQSLKPITIFLCITLALSAIFYFLIYSGTLGGDNMYNRDYVVSWNFMITMKILKNISDLDGNGEKLNIKFGLSYPYFTH